MASKPESIDDVFRVMKSYSQKKGYSFSDVKLKFIAEDCYLLYESRGWYGIKYWPPLAMKWLLNVKCKFGKETPNYKTPKPQKGKSIRDTILESEEQENGQ